jgi:DNA-binding HxlR family transcriptional regulator
LTNKGNDLIPLLEGLCQWGKVYEKGKRIEVYS